MIERTELQQAADGFDSINVDGDGLCMWTDVANALGNLRRVISHHAPQACRCGPMCEDRHRPGCRRFDVTPTRTALRALVDAVWQHATDSTAVPSTDIADRLITRTIIPSHDGPHLAASTVEPVADDEDMAAIGRALMEAIEQARDADEWVKAWAPAQCPSEIVFDLLNREPTHAGTPAPVAALERAEQAFEAIRNTLINNLQEPERSAFWKAVSARDEIRAVLATPTTSPEPDAVREDRWSDALSAINSISANPARAGQHLDIRIVGPGCSVTLLELDDFRELVARARLAGLLSRNHRGTEAG